MLSTPCLSTFCTNCSSPPRQDVKLKRCTRCRIVWYCSDVSAVDAYPICWGSRIWMQKCHTLDWEIHKYECKALQKWAEMAPENAKVPSDALRALGRILWSFRQHGLDSDWVRQYYMWSHSQPTPFCFRRILSINYNPVSRMDVCSVTVHDIVQIGRPYHPPLSSRTPILRIP